MEELPEKSNTQRDPWAELKRYTSARIALGRSGRSIPSRALLQFKLDHAHARDAIFAALNIPMLLESLEKVMSPVFLLRSQAPTRQIYIQRPDLGRELSAYARTQLEAAGPYVATDLAIILADGLSARAINDHAVPLLSKLMPLLVKANITISPISLVELGRVAVSDEIGSLLKSSVALILIGERPGLSSPDSLGAYMTYAPRPGLTDESRNCISNIRPAGLGYEIAAMKICYLVVQALAQRLSGVALKDNGQLLG
ncbi:MAG: ethanolamine ammonia-lyase subunit EutC [Chryseolinea sp.]